MRKLKKYVPTRFMAEDSHYDKAEAACESARQNPGEENAFRQLRLNQWVKQSIRWMPMEKWDACAFPVNEDDLEGRVVMENLNFQATQTSHPSAWCFRLLTRMINIMFFRTSGCQKRLLICESEGTM